MFNNSNLRHGIINVGDLPIPFDLVLNAAVLVVVLTFVFLKVSWKESILTSKETLFSTKQSTSGKLFGFLILALLTVLGLINNEAATVSITPLILWVFLWIGVPVLGLLFGDLYAKFNPLSILVLLFIFTSPVYYLGSDWGRYIFISYSGSFFLYI